MNILHIIWSAHFGGIERLVIDLVRCQKNNHGLQPAILIASSPQGDFINQIQGLGVAIHHGMLISGFDCSPVKLLRIFKICRQYDVLHFHSFNPAVALCSGISRKAIVYTEHGNFGFGRQWTTADKIK